MNENLGIEQVYVASVTVKDSGSEQKLILCERFWKFNLDHPDEFVVQPDFPIWEYGRQNLHKIYVFEGLPSDYEVTSLVCDYCMDRWEESNVCNSGD